jgi:ABC-type Fe3+-siderophore transport system permease subunit
MAWRYPLALLLILALAALHLQLSNPLPLPAQLSLLFKSPGSLAEVQIVDANWPRMVMALLVGAALGISGSVVQQLTQNRLMSPMTLGASSGAWLALVATSIWLPQWTAAHGSWAALAGALLAAALVLLIAGPRGIGGLRLVLAGMTLSLLLGAVASALVMLHDQYVRDLFLWGAGDLAQYDWHWVSWLWPRLWPLPLLLWLAPRPLTLLRLGSEGAQGRGMSLLPVLLFLLLAALWINCVAITAAGLIGFIGLLTPNFARAIGAKTARDELLLSGVLGSALLLFTDMLALLASQGSIGQVPSGITAALIGAPGLLWFSQQQERKGRQPLLQEPASRHRPSLLWCGVLIVLALASLFWLPDADGWHFAWPDALIWSFRWPRILTTLAAACGLATAGVILQRLLRNPLASPDILGLSAGSTLALVLMSLLLHRPLQQDNGLTAFAGSALVLLALFGLGRRHRYAPATMVLVGISLSALLDAVLQFALTRGSADTFTILGWLAGSTYHVSARQALQLTLEVVVLGSMALLGQRSLTLIGIDDAVASGRGLPLGPARMGWLLLAALLTACVTSLVGPIGFLGLLAPHIARLLGARRVVPQLGLSAAVACLLLLIADWLARVVVYPAQLPAGIVASVICGAYLTGLLVLRRSGGRW